MDNHPILLPERLLLTRSKSRNGDIEVKICGAFEVAPSLVWQNSRVHVAVLGSKGQILATNDHRFDAVGDAIDGCCIFEFGVDLNSVLLKRAAAVEVWALGTVNERRAHLSMPLSDLPKPANGSVSMHFADEFTVKRGTLERDGDVRVTVYAQCRFTEGASYDDRGKLHVTLFDAAETVVFHEESRFDTYGGCVGPANVDEGFNLNEPILEASERLELEFVVERFVRSERVVVPWSDVVKLRTD